MADTPGAPQPPGMHKLYYALTPDIAQELRRANPALTAAEWRLWSLLVTLDPFGDRYQDLPELVEILVECDLSKPTFYRAIAKFEDLKLFDTQPLKIAFRNLRGQKIVSNLRHEFQKRDENLKNENSVSNLRQDSQKRDSPFLEPAQSKGSENSNVPITDLVQTCSETTEQIVSPSIDRDELGTAQLLELITNAGIRTNKTIQQTVINLYRTDPDAAQTIRNALSALTEQRKQGTVRNPGGFFVAAIKQRFTANEAKRNARTRQDNAAARGSPPQQFDEIDISRQIDSYLIDGRRDWAIAKLQQLYRDHPDQTTELLSLRRDWHITLTNLQEQS